MIKTVMIAAMFLVLENVSAQSQQTAKPSSEKLQSSSADFPGDTEALYKLIISKLDQSKIDSKVRYTKGTANFTVMPDGSMDNIIVDIDNESLKNAFKTALQNIQIKWKPATVNGVKIKSNFRLPIVWAPE